VTVEAEFSWEPMLRARVVGPSAVKTSRRRDRLRREREVGGVRGKCVGQRDGRGEMLATEDVEVKEWEEKRRRD
jgi:hypothetical protein